jgi:ABC-2 type transport system permease protein
MTHVGVLLRKELIDIGRNRAALLPVALVTIISLALPFAIALIIPAVTGHALGSDADLVKVSRVAGAPEALAPNARVQLFLFEQFLTLFLITPITGAMALAAHSIVGEKMGRTLEPLLASPVTTAELLVAKVLGSLLPTLAFSAAGLVVYFVVIAMYADPGVAANMFTTRTFLLTVVVGPLSALVALQLTVLVSSRVNDARTAQQFGVLIILPLTALVVAQFTGTFWLSASQMGLVALGLAAVWLLLMLISVPLFDREAILTRWR